MSDAAGCSPQRGGVAQTSNDRFLRTEPDGSSQIAKSIAKRSRSQSIFVEILHHISATRTLMRFRSVVEPNRASNHPRQFVGLTRTFLSPPASWQWVCIDFDRRAWR